MGFQRNLMQEIEPGVKPGTITIDGKEYNVKDWTEGYVFDTEYFPIGTVIAAGNLFNFFQSLTFQVGAFIGTPKAGIDTNMREPSRLPGQWIAVFKNIYFDIVAPSLRVDVENIYRSAYISLIIGNQKTEVDMPARFKPSPFGLGGIISLDGALAATEVSALNNGTVGRNTVPASLPLKIADSMQFRVECRFDRGFTFNAVGPGTPAQGYTAISIVIPCYFGKPVF